MGLTGWLAPMLLSVVALGAIALYVAIRAWPAKPVLSAEEQADVADAPMAPLQKRAWLGLSIAVVTSAIVTSMVASNGAAEYWDNDDLRLRVVFVFIGGLIAWAVIPALLLLKGGPDTALDERDRAILSRAPTIQPAAILIALAAWMITLTERFHDQGAVPVVYLYLIFGSVMLVNMITQPLGVLLGYWIGLRHGQG